MKTSNKILLGTFLTAILIIVSVHVALFAKYKKGQYTLITDDMWPTNMITESLHDVKYVSINNVENVIVRPADTNKLQYDKPENGDENILEITRRADTLFLSGKSIRRPHGRWYRTTNLLLADPLSVKVINSQLHLLRTPSKSDFKSMNILLDHSFLEVNNDQTKELHLESLKIDGVADSRISLRNVHTKLLDVTLKDSFLEETKLNADSIRVTTDTLSRLQLSGKNLSKTKIITYE